MFLSRNQSQGRLNSVSNQQASLTSINAPTSESLEQHPPNDKSHHHKRYTNKEIMEKLHKIQNTMMTDQKHIEVLKQQITDLKKE